MNIEENEFFDIASKKVEEYIDNDMLTSSSKFAFIQGYEEAMSWNEDMETCPVKLLVALKFEDGCPFVGEKTEDGYFYDSYDNLMDGDLEIVAWKFI